MVKATKDEKPATVISTDMMKAFGCMFRSKITPACLLHLLCSPEMQVLLVNETLSKPSQVTSEMTNGIELGPVQFLLQGSYILDIILYRTSYICRWFKTYMYVFPLQTQH